MASMIHEWPISDDDTATRTFSLKFCSVKAENKAAKRNTLKILDVFS